MGQIEVVVSDAPRTTSVILLQGLVGENDFAEAVSRIEPDGLPLLQVQVAERVVVVDNVAGIAFGYSVDVLLQVVAGFACQMVVAAGREEQGCQKRNEKNLSIHRIPPARLCSASDKNSC